MAAIVRRCLVTLESSEKLAHHAVAIEAEPVWVEADQARIEQIIMNLMSNSLKFTPNGGAIKVIVRREQDEAVLQIVDDGSGISADLLPSVFDLFVQGDRNIDRRSAGLGVGLTLVRRLVELHGGRGSCKRWLNITVRASAAFSVRDEHQGVHVNTMNTMNTMSTLFIFGRGGG